MPTPDVSPADPHVRARRLLGTTTVDDAALRGWLRTLPGVDEAGANARATRLATRVLAGSALRWALDAAIGMVDLTTLEGADTPATVRALGIKARHPDPDDPGCPPVAAVCVYPDLVTVAADIVAGSTVTVASVATGFPAGRSGVEARLADTRLALDSGAHEIDMVIDRGAFLTGRYGQVFDEIARVSQLCRARTDGPGPAHLKVILETGELAGYDTVRRASWLAMLAGADVIKTSTGKVSPAATLPVTVVMLQAVRDWYTLTGRVVGVKPAGGIRTATEALRYLVAVHETAGTDWLTPSRFRFGASGLLDDLIRVRRAARTTESDPVDAAGPGHPPS
jgi:deoxyribose-phosphate aldolase